MRDDLFAENAEVQWKHGFEVHPPQFGSPPEYASGMRIKILVPLWLPLSVVLGWIVIRELRWQEKRPRDAQAAS